MGRVDADLMYDMVMSWDWGGSGEDIYHDTETRRNGITYRGKFSSSYRSSDSKKRNAKSRKYSRSSHGKNACRHLWLLHAFWNPILVPITKLVNNEKARQLYL